MLWWRRARAWSRRHPFVADALLAVLVAAPALRIPVDGPDGRVVMSAGVAWLTVAGCAAIVARRLWPLPVWVVTLASAVAVVLVDHGPSGAVLPLMVALYTVGAWRPARISLVVGAASGLILLAAEWVATSSWSWSGSPTYVMSTWCVLATLVGVAVRGQRHTVLEAQERARIAEESRDEEAQRRVSDERLRIARDLHDVVAHHIAIVTVQSGVAEHLLDQDPQGAREAIKHVREASSEVLAEMSTLLGVLRSEGEDGERGPARGLGDVDELVESLRRTGLRISVREQGHRAQLAPLVDLTAYRVIEQALTNARRYGSDESADVSIAHGPVTTTIEVRNRAAWTDGEKTGYGLAGMRERVTAIGGTIDAGPDSHGWFVVRVDLPSPVPVGGDQ